jgi:hypothetical protein
LLTLEVRSLANNRYIGAEISNGSPIFLRKTCELPVENPARIGTWHSEHMARGWESKGVESQIESAGERAALARKPTLNPEEVERVRQRESLELSRKRVLHDLEASKRPGHRALLEAALKHLDEKIAALS